jgi:hypothetical protein
VLVSKTMIAQAGRNNWSELLTLVRAPKGLTVCVRTLLALLCGPEPLPKGGAGASWRVSNPAQNGRCWMCDRGRGEFLPWSSVMSSFLFWVRGMVEAIRDSVRKRFTAETYPGKFPSQRMCPFCGLITARAKAFCLECGKSLREAHP